MQRFWGSRSTARQCKGSAWDRKEKNRVGWGKALGTQKGTNLPKPLICAEAKPSERPKPTKNQRFCTSGRAFPRLGITCPEGSTGIPQVKAKATRADIPLFLAVFHFLPFFPLFLTAQGVELRCPGLWQCRRVGNSSSFKGKFLVVWAFFFVLFFVFS